MIRIDDYDQPDDISKYVSDETIEYELEVYIAGHDRFPHCPTFKVWFALWQFRRHPDDLPESWFPREADTVYLKDIVLLIIKIALSHTVPSVLIF